MPDLARLRVLVIDDEPHIVKVIRKQLEIAGFEVSAAGDGSEGLAAVRAWRPDLVILDILLPGMDGYAVCEALKRDPALRQIPVLMLTAKALPAEQVEGFRRGADGYLTKPFQLEELLGEIRRLLAKSGTGKGV